MFLKLIGVESQCFPCLSNRKGDGVWQNVELDWPLCNILYSFYSSTANTIN